MIRKRLTKRMIVIAVLVIVIATILIVYAQLSNRRSSFYRMVRSIKGEVYVEQKANDLADDLRRIPMLAQIQPWALEAMGRFRAGGLRGENGSHLYWATNVFTLAPEETPQFIKTQWGKTNEFGEILPWISIVLSNGQPEYVVIDWLGWGIAVGPLDYRVTFGPQGTNEVAPGVYTYFIEK